MTTSTITSSDRLLRNALRGNGVFSSFSGAVFILFAAPITTFLSVAPDAFILVALIGIGLLGFAASLFWNASRPTIDPQLALSAIIGDVLWVAGSLVILLIDPFNFSTPGRWATLIIADAVAIFAVLQTVGLRRIRQ